MTLWKPLFLEKLNFLFNLHFFIRERKIIFFLTKRKIKSMNSKNIGIASHVLGAIKCFPHTQSFLIGY
jgi:hypothetical protein